MSNEKERRLTDKDTEEIEFDLKNTKLDLAALAGLFRQHTQDLFNERDALLAEISRLREALANAAIPYEALLMDAESRKWIAPEVWAAIESAVTAARAATRQGNTDAE